MTHRIPSTIRARGGFSLLEVLVAVVILSVGLLALASLQMSLIRSSAESKSQSTAMAIANDQLEVMRGFNSLDEYRLRDSSTPGAVTAGFVDYTPTITVARYVFDKNANGGAGQYIAVDNTATDAQIDSVSCGTATNGHACIAGRDFKRVSVSVAWTDATGVSRNVAIEDAFGADNPGDSANASRASKSVAPRPIVIRIYNPGATDGVIPIAISNNSNTAATNPTPEVAGRNTASAHVVETRFDVFTYGAVNGSTAVATNRVETVIAGCQCDAVTQTSVRGYRPTYWDGDKYTSPEAVTSYYAPGQVATSGLPATQSARCTICCRDHWDPAGVAGAKFSPRRGTHSHYGIDGITETTSFDATTGNPSTTVAPDNALGSPVTSGRYLEACRIIRVDGIFRVAADEYNDHTDLIQTSTDSGNIQGSPTLPPATASASIPSTYNYASATGFVLTYMGNRYITSGNAKTQAFYNTASNGGNPTANSLHPASISMSKQDVINRWMHLRGLYVDYLEPVAVTRINDAKTACAAANAAIANSCDLSATILALIPFTSINITEVANWRAARQTLTGNGNNAQNPFALALPYYTDSAFDHLYVANNDFLSSLTDPNPVRGASTPGYSVPFRSQGSNGSDLLVSPKLSGEIYSGNSGLALLLDPVNADETVQQDIQNFAMASGNPGASSGSFQVIFPLGSQQNPLYTFSQSSAGYPKITSPSPSIRCSFSTANGGNPKKPNPFTCVTRSIGAGLAMSITNYNYQTTESVSTSTVPLSCTNTDGSGSTTPYVSTSGGAATYTRTVCKNYQMGAVTSGRTITPNPPTSISGSLVNEGLLNETATLNIASPGVQAGDQFSVPLSVQSPTYVAPTCLYTTVNGSTTFDVAANGCP